MKTAKEMYQYARKNKLGFNLTFLLGIWLAKKSFKMIEDSLIEHEEVVASFIGRFFDADNYAPEVPQDAENHVAKKGHSEHLKPKWRDCDGFYSFAITTENRILFAKWKPFNHDTMSIPLNNINNVNVSTNFFFGTVKVETFGEEFYIYWTSGTVRRIGKVIQTYISDAADGGIDGVTRSMRAKEKQ